MKIRNVAIARACVATLFLISSLAPAQTLSEPIPRLGVYDKMVIGLFNALPQDGAPGTVYFGSPYHDSWISAILHDASGRTYWFMQTHGVLPEPRLMTLRSNPGQKFMQPIPGVTSPQQSMPGLPSASRPVDFTYEPGRGLHYRGSGETATFDILLNEHEFSWKDAVGLDLRGRLAAPGIQFMIPWRHGEETGGQTYFEQSYLAQGTFKGVPVTGIIYFEHNYDKKDSPWMSSPFSMARGAVLGFTNEYEDGAIESGYISCSKDPFRGALITDPKGDLIVRTLDVNIDKKLDEDGHLVSVLYKMGDGSRWLFTPDEGAAIGDPKVKNPPFTQSFGKIMRVGEKRKLKRWWSVTQLRLAGLCESR